MITAIKKLNRKTYPQNFMVRKPFLGTLLFTAFLFVFIIIYKPLGVRGARNFNLILTIFLYQLIASVPVFSLALILKRTNCFSKDKGWNFLKEIKTVFLFVFVFGISIYFLGFLLEEPAQRWNMPTFLDAVFRAFLIGIIPFLSFTLANIRYLYVTDITQEFHSGNQFHKPEAQEEPIHIISQAKKEELKFFPDQFVYAESKGNYVLFHLQDSGKFKTAMIRNSISNIEKQLSVNPFFVRTHRAFIVHIKKISSKKGNSLGYRLKITGINDEIPVSRQNTKKFDKLIQQFR